MLSNKSKKILITGGAGFIGSNLSEYFLSKGHYVICLDNFSTGHRNNLNNILLHPNYKLIEGDIRNLDDCQKSVKECDFVLHQAALGSVPRSIHDPITTNEVNVSGFINMLVASRDAKVKRFIYAASSSTYGDSEILPKEENKIGRPLSPYAVTKYVNELYADIFSKTYGLETIGLRYFNVFGRKQDPLGSYAAVIPKFILQLLKHQSPLINGNGEFSRDFTYIDNILQINELALFVQNSNAINTVYNAAFGECTSLNELITYMKEELSNYDALISKVPIKYGTQRIGDIPHSLASISKARMLLKYSPNYSLKEGLKETIAWYWKIFNDV